MSISIAHHGELLPCPFCGCKNPEYSGHYYDLLDRIDCPDCGASGPTIKIDAGIVFERRSYGPMTARELAERWNDREER